MAFPSSLDSFTNPGAAQKLNAPSHSTIETAQNTALSALETKVGVDSSAVATSIDYLVKTATSPGHKHVTADITDAGTYVSAGSIMHYAGLTVPSGFVLCDAATISRTTYASLFAAIGTAFGVGDGATTFTIPMGLPNPSVNSYAVKFVAASSTYLSKASAASLNIGSNFSASAWVNFVSLPTAGNSMAFLSKYTTAGNQRSYIFRITNSTGQKLELIASSDGSSAATMTSSAVTIAIGEWHHVAVSYVASTGISTFYFDGVSVSTASGGPATLFASSGSLNLGAYDEGTQNFLDAYMVNAKVLNTNLSQDGVIKNMVYGNQSNTQGSWSLNNVLTDTSGNTNTLTNHSTTFVVQSVPDCRYIQMIKT